MASQEPVTTEEDSAWSLLPKLAHLSVIVGVAGVGLCLSIIGLGAGVVALAVSVLLALAAGIGNIIRLAPEWLHVSAVPVAPAPRRQGAHPAPGHA